MDMASSDYLRRVWPTGATSLNYMFYGWKWGDSGTVHEKSKANLL